MSLVCLQKDKSYNIAPVYPEGEHILGRGKKLDCTSKRVSRKHAKLIVTDSKAILVANHNNPCFYKTASSENLTILTIGNRIELDENDKISLYLEDGWYTVRTIFENSNNCDNTTDNPVPDINIKRKNDDSKESTSKKIKAECDKSNSTALPVNETSIDSSNIIFEIQKSEDGNSLAEIKLEPDDQFILQPIDPIENDDMLPMIFVKEEPLSNENSPEIKQEPPDDVEEIKPEPVFVDVNMPSTSGTNNRPWRDRCWYGSSCKRKNREHFANVTHPGDSDYDSDPEDKRPICRYGIECYRRCPGHRFKFRHPGQTKLGKKPEQKRQNSRKINPPNTKLPTSEDQDICDYYVPFSDGGSSDEYQPTDTSETESEYDSQEIEEETKRLIAEAKKFTRK